MPLRVRAFVNPRAGGLIHRSAEALANRLENEVTAAGHRLERCLVDADVDRSLTALLADDRPDVLVVVAGDGTVRAAAERLLGTATALAIVPGGTFNLLARDLGVPNDVDAAVPALVRGRPETIDAARVNGELFLSACALGLGAEACSIREQVRAAGLADWPETVFDAARRFVDAQPIAMRIDDGRRRFAVKSHAVFVANGPFRRNGLELMRRESLASGHLALYAQRHPSRWQALKTLVHSRFGGFRAGEIIDESLDELVIETRPETVLATIDGELQELHSPLVFKVIRAGLVVVRAGPATIDAG